MENREFRVQNPGYFSGNTTLEIENWGGGGGEKVGYKRGTEIGGRELGTETGVETGGRIESTAV
jgi:hypothetical protein